MTQSESMLDIKAVWMAHPHQCEEGLVFHWEYGFPGGVSGGGVMLLAEKPELQFDDKRDDEDNQLKTSNLDELLQRVAMYGWGEPPFIRAVWAEVVTLHKLFDKSTDEFKGMLDFMGRWWDALSQYL
jgi:hypothetical protein